MASRSCSAIAEQTVGLAGDCKARQKRPEIFCDFHSAGGDLLNGRGAGHCLPVRRTSISRRRAIGLMGGLAAAATVNCLRRRAWAVTGGWSPWARVPNVPRLTFSPAATASPAGPIGGPYVWVYGVTADDFSLGYVKWNGRHWGSWQNLGGKWTSSPGACPTDLGGQFVYCRGVDNAIYQNDGLVQHWDTLGGAFTSAPAAAFRTKLFGGTGIDVFARGGDYAIWQRAYRGNWSDWLSVGGSLTSAPAVASGGTTLLDVFARGNDNRLWHRNWDENRENRGTWTNWESLGGSFTSAPAAVAWGGNAGLPYQSYVAQHLDVFGLGNDRALWHRSLDHGRWSAWESLGGQNIAGDPTVASWGAGRLDVFVLTTGGQLWTRSHQA